MPTCVRLFPKDLAQTWQAVKCCLWELNVLWASYFSKKSSCTWKQIWWSERCRMRTISRQRKLSKQLMIGTSTTLMPATWNAFLGPWVTWLLSTNWSPFWDDLTSMAMQKLTCRSFHRDSSHHYLSIQRNLDAQSHLQYSLATHRPAVDSQMFQNRLQLPIKMATQLDTALGSRQWLLEATLEVGKQWCSHKDRWQGSLKFKEDLRSNWVEPVSLRNPRA